MFSCTQVLVSRQRSAFPPNFVHSLDSSHMMMTALACHEAGLTFAGINFLLHQCPTVYVMKDSTICTVILQGLMILL